MTKTKIGYGLLILFGVLASAGMFVLAPIRQNPDYHSFADQNTFLGIPNFWNVISNLPFLIVGVMGLISSQRAKQPRLDQSIFFTGVALVAFGSCYYHWIPSSESLVWDRLPMTIGFMALCAMIIREFINEKTGQNLLLTLLVIGLTSVVYWSMTDDLSLYLFVQFYPMIAIPIVLLLFTSDTPTRGYWLLLLFYVIAKVFEIYDVQTFEFTGWISGHSLKHIFAAMGISSFLHVITMKARSI